MAFSGSDTLECASTLLLQACKEGNNDLVRELLSSPPYDLMACDENSNTALHLAVEQGHLAVVKELAGRYTALSAGKNTKGQTPLHLASMRGHFAVVKALAQQFRGDLEARDEYGNTPLHLAALFGHTETVDLLCQQFCCDPSVKGFQDRTAIHHACSGGHLSLAEKLILEYKCSAVATDMHRNTPLHCAAFYGHADVVFKLATLYGWSKGFQGTTVLHHACAGGHLCLARKLISDYGFDPMEKDDTGETSLHWTGVNIDLLASLGNFHATANTSHVNTVRMLVTEYQCPVNCVDLNGDTALNLASLAGHAEVVGVLISEFSCSPSITGQYGQTPLHRACEGGHLNVVGKLVSEYGCDLNIRNNSGRTPLHVAAQCGREEVVRELIIKYKCPVDCVDSKGYTPLHLAAAHGHVSVMCVLISEFGCSPSVKGHYGQTPLHDAALAGREEVTRELITRYKCPVDCVNSDGDTPLHLAACQGHVGVVRMLLSTFGADVCMHVHNNNGETALNLAALNGQAEVVGVLITELGCSPSVKGQYGRTPLHQACNCGHLDVVVKLISEYGCDVNPKDENRFAPLSVAAQVDSEELVTELIAKYKCPVDCVDSDGYTPLHLAAINGHVGIVKILADVDCNNYGNTALMTEAGIWRDAEVVGILISKFGCSPSVKDFSGRTPLHHACEFGHLDLVKKLVSEYGCDINARDNDGHTPLYFAICNHHSSIVAELVRHNTDLIHVDTKHEKLLESAKRHSKHARTKAFVVGAPQVGKSTLIEALKSETYFQWNLNQNQIPTHTAGIVPLFHESSNYGWVVFYDFAGDEEYYSSHAAILDNIMGTFSNLFILVFDLSKYLFATERMQLKYAENSIYYWLTFLSYRSSNHQKSSRLQVLLIGSHADVLQKEGKDAENIISEIFTDISQSFYTEFPDSSVEMLGYVALNCCLTKSQGLRKIKAQLKQVQLSSLSDVPWLTAGASILLGTLERDFQCKVACQMKEIIEHIKSHELYIPSETEQLHSYLKELHAYGAVLLLECTSPREDEWIVLNLPFFLSTVHERLFSTSLHGHESSLSNLGIIPNARLKTMFPEFSLALLKGCMTLLQYCQEICDTQIISNILEISTFEAGSVLFFPALLQSSRSKVKWIRSHSSLCCIGWYAECFRTYDFFPPRFLHVLLLRLAFTFALPNDDDRDATMDVYSRKCTLWKNGIHWLMESGVEVVVEVVKQKRAVLVMVRGSTDQHMECGDILNKVVAKVVEAKSEFCNVLKASLYIVSSDDLKQSTIPEVDKLQFFKTTNIQKVLLRGSEGAVSRDGKGFLPSSDLICLQTQTSWNQLFPMWIKDLMQHLEDIVVRWYELGVQLDVPTSKLNEIKCNNPGDVYQCKLLMLQEWQRRPTLKPSWCTLVNALRNMKENTIVERISQQYDVDLQRKLLDPSLASCKLDDDTLQQLIDAISDKWASIAPLLCFTSAEIEQIKSENCPARAMLQKLKDKGTLTHEKLYHCLKTVSLLKSTI